MSVLADTMASRRGAGTRRPLLAVLHDWVVTVDHKRLGVMYVISGLVFLVVAGLEASAMRLQLASSGLHVVPPRTVNQLFTGPPWCSWWESPSCSDSPTTWCR